MSRGIVEKDIYEITRRVGLGELVGEKTLHYQPKRKL